MEAQHKYTSAGELEQAQVVIRHRTEQVAIIRAVRSQAKEVRALSNKT